jgi:hypothetical protein
MSDGKSADRDHGGRTMLLECDELIFPVWATALETRYEFSVLYGQASTAGLAVEHRELVSVYHDQHSL